MLLVLLACDPTPTDLATWDSAWESDDERVVVNGSCVPPGEAFLDHYTCETVNGPTGDVSVGSSAKHDPDPETLADPDYDWVIEQITACSCTCCHAEGSQAAHIWSFDFAPDFATSAADEIFEQLDGAEAGHFGQPDPDQNYGFDRYDGSLPTQDIERLRGFVDRELERRAAR